MADSQLPSGTIRSSSPASRASTKLLHELGPQDYAEALDQQRQVVRESCRRHGGVEVDTQGDAFSWPIQRAPEAVEAAQAITEGLASGPVRLRIGLHTGTPLLTDEGYVGAAGRFEEAGDALERALARYERKENLVRAARTRDRWRRCGRRRPAQHER